MTSAWPVLLLVVVGRALTALQAPTNALLSRAVGSPINAALVSFVVGSVVLADGAAALAAKPSGEAMRALPWYAWVAAQGASGVASTDAQRDAASLWTHSLMPCPESSPSRLLTRACTADAMFARC